MNRKFSAEVFAERVDELLREQGMNKTDLAVASGIDRSYFSNLTGGRASNPTIGTVESIAEALNTTPSYLLGWSDHPGYIVQGMEDLPEWTEKTVEQLLSLPESRQMLAYYLVMGVKVAYGEERRKIEADLRGKSNLVKTLAQNETQLRELLELMGLPRDTADQLKIIAGV